MSTQTYGTIPTSRKNTRITYSSQLSNGTSSVNTAGTLEEDLECLWADIATNTPAPFSTHPVYTSFILVSAEPQMRLLGMANIHFVYQCSYTGTPSTQYTEQNSSTQAPITEHPSFDDWAADEIFDDNGQFIGFSQSSDKFGIESYIVPASIVTKKEYFTSEPPDERGNIGKTQNPGRDYSGDDNWLVTGSTRALEGLFWTRTTTYEWSAVAWNSDIYPAA